MRYYLASFIAIVHVAHALPLAAETNSTSLNAPSSPSLKEDIRGGVQEIAVAAGANAASLQAADKYISSRPLSEIIDDMNAEASEHEGEPGWATVSEQTSKEDVGMLNPDHFMHLLDLSFLDPPGQGTVSSDATLGKAASSEGWKTLADVQRDTANYNTWAIIQEAVEWVLQTAFNAATSIAPAVAENLEAWEARRLSESILALNEAIDARKGLPISTKLRDEFLRRNMQIRDVKAMLKPWVVVPASASLDWNRVAEVDSSTKLPLTWYVVWKRRQGPALDNIAVA